MEGSFLRVSALHLVVTFFLSGEKLSETLVTKSFFQMVFAENWLVKLY